MFEAAVAGGLPIVRLLKQSLFLNKINKISGILNGTTNFILSEMEKKNLNFNEILEFHQKWMKNKQNMRIFLNCTSSNFFANGDINSNSKYFVCKN